MCKPVVVTHVAASPDVSIDGVTSSIVNPHDLWRSKMLLNGLFHISYSGKNGNLALLRASFYHSWEKSADIKIAFYSSILSF